MSAQEWRSKPRITRTAMAADLRELGVRPGAVVLVHSSLSRLGFVEGGAEAAIAALIDAVTPGGTVLFPTLTGSERDGPAYPPYMDVRGTPCWTGRIPEVARFRSDAIRSLHPTHSVAAIGGDAARYTSGHERTMTPCDQHSPYYRLVDEAGLILLLGADQTSNTTLHCLEELAAVPYHLQPDFTDGVVVDETSTRIVVRNRLHLWRWERDFAKIDAPLLQAGAMVIGRVGQAEARLIRADQLAAILLPILRADPLYLLSTAAEQLYRKGGA
jgi:aminoglycoside 3-N-acetyltransferase